VRGFAGAAVLLTLALACYPDADAIRHTIAAATDAGGDAPALTDAPGAADSAPLLPPGAAAADCTDFGLAWCEKSRQCGTLDYEILGGADVCAARMKLWCESLLVGPADSGWAPPTFNACITSWSAMTCNDWADVDLEILKGPACVVAGQRPDGAGCWSFSQCAGMACARSAACGKCTTRIPAAGACKADSDCLVGLVCGQDRCVAPADAGAACDQAHPCRHSLRCNAGTCAARASAGQPCTTHEDCTGGLLCNASRVCGPARPSPTRCSPQEPDGSVLYCGGGRSCGADQTCATAAADDAACTADGKPGCLWPALCYGNRCTLPAPITCAP
jgi:hypothetical protein